MQNISLEVLGYKANIRKHKGCISIVQTIKAHKLHENNPKSLQKQHGYKPQKLHKHGYKTKYNHQEYNHQRKI